MSLPDKKRKFATMRDIRNDDEDNTVGLTPGKMTVFDDSKVQGFERVIIYASSEDEEDDGDEHQPSEGIEEPEHKKPRTSTPLSKAAEQAVSAERSRMPIDIVTNNFKKDTLTPTKTGHTLREYPERLPPVFPVLAIRKTKIDSAAPPGANEGPQATAANEQVDCKCALCEARARRETDEAAAALGALAAEREARKKATDKTD